MRRNEKEITDEAVIESVIKQCHVCRIAMIDGDSPYVVPVCFGYKNRVLYIHGADTGKKITALRTNPRVCFECDTDTELVRKEKACNWGMRFLSVIGFGQVEFVEDSAEKKLALDIIMAQYSDGTFDYADASFAKTAVIKIVIENMTCKQSGF